MIVAYYGISYVTVKIYIFSLKERTKLCRLLEVVSSPAKFENIPIRRHEEVRCRCRYDRLPIKLEASAHFKTFLLLQIHFSRIALPPDLVTDHEVI
ncbi:hypothetical protein K435DRAFT_22420 [Dendrothele bispora CBS 962.96]|uniref:SEC63 domain-containing protein n=1 Tax=Dendrothele bispora (strain CBS 962.96) TaxID=1314807 RepID=A0A4S8MTX8_DENBC|nr:hypothetical protein K435DRAFT_22420 [Dendrothele bispora CBS 962.96]